MRNRVGNEGGAYMYIPATISCGPFSFHKSRNSISSSSNLVMAGTLIFHTYQSIFTQAKRLRDHVNEIECAKERRDQTRKLKREPIVRMLLLIESAAGYKCAELKNLSEEERTFKYALDNFANAKRALVEFRRLVLQPAREEDDFQKWYRRVNNQGKQHPDFCPERIVFGDENVYSKTGETYFDEMLTRCCNIKDEDCDVRVEWSNAALC